MQIQKGHGEETTDAIFRHCVNGSTGTEIARGDVVIFDVTDNRAITGIMRNTAGTRVLQSPAGAEAAFTDLPLIAGVAEQVGPVTKANQTKNETFLVQCSGYHDAVKFSGGTTSTAKRVAHIGAVAGAADMAAATSATVPTIVERMGMVGIYPYTIGSTPSHVPVIIKGMGCL